jgi:hypothetical protein
MQHSEIVGGLACSRRARLLEGHPLAQQPVVDVLLVYLSNDRRLRFITPFNSAIAASIWMRLPDLRSSSSAPVVIAQWSAAHSHAREGSCLNRQPCAR